MLCEEENIPYGIVLYGGAYSILELEFHKMKSLHLGNIPIETVLCQPDRPSLQWHDE